MLNTVTCICFKESFVSPVSRQVFLERCSVSVQTSFFTCLLHYFFLLGSTSVCSCHPVNITKNPLGLDEKMGGGGERKKSHCISFLVSCVTSLHPDTDYCQHCARRFLCLNSLTSHSKRDQRERSTKGLTFN